MQTLATLYRLGDIEEYGRQLGYSKSNYDSHSSM